MDSVTVVSLAPYQTKRYQREEHPAPLVIEGKKEGQPYFSMTVKGGNSYRDFGEGQRMPVPTSARDIATDLVRGLEDHGVFIAEGEKPTADELAAAREKRKAFNLKQVELADSKWATTGDKSKLPWHAFFAVKELGFRREWAMNVSEMEPCPVCKEVIQIGAIVCGKCQAVLKPQEAADYGMLSPEKLEYFKSRGKVATLRAPEAR